MEKNTISKGTKEYGEYRYQAGRFHGVMVALDAVMNVYEREKEFMSFISADGILNEIYDALTSLELEEKEEYFELRKSFQ